MTSRTASDNAAAVADAVVESVLSDRRPSDLTDDFVPCIRLPSSVSPRAPAVDSHDADEHRSNAFDNDDDDEAKLVLARRIIAALRKSGFLLVETDMLPPELQADAVEAACTLLRSSAADDGAAEPQSAALQELSRQTVAHPTDPKTYVMWESLAKLEALRELFDSETLTDPGQRQPPSSPDRNGTTVDASAEPFRANLDRAAASVRKLIEYWHALERTKYALLKYMGIGLYRSEPSERNGSNTGNSSGDSDSNIADRLRIYQDPNMLCKLHDQNHSALRLLYYPRVETAACPSSDPPQDDTEDSHDTIAAATVTDNKDDGADNVVIRCKPHSDYGSITLLLSDGVPGLQIYDESTSQWRDVPHVPGSVVVNLGSLLSEWTDQQLLATLHRVVGVRAPHPLSAKRADKKDNVESADRPRVSLAFFCDPNPDIALDELQNNAEGRSKSGTGAQSTLGSNGDRTPVSSGAAVSSVDVPAGRHDEISTVADYTRWRSGLDTSADSNADIDSDDIVRERSGVAFTQIERQRMKP